MKKSNQALHRMLRTGEFGRYTYRIRSDWKFLSILSSKFRLASSLRSQPYGVYVQSSGNDLRENRSVFCLLNKKTN